MSEKLLMYLPSHRVGKTWAMDRAAEHHDYGRTFSIPLNEVGALPEVALAQEMFNQCQRASLDWLYFRMLGSWLLAPRRTLAPHWDDVQ